MTQLKSINLRLNNIFSSYKQIWIIILLLAFFLRAYGLDINPVGLSHDDELHEIMNAKSLALTGSHKPGTVAGIFTQNDQCLGNCVYGELGSYILIPWMWIFPLSLFWSKIPFVLASLGLVYFTGKLFENFSNNSKIGLLAGLAVAINPWAIHFGRTAYFTSFSYLFYILAAYFFTRRSSFKYNLIWGILFSILGSMFYFGTKPILPLIVIWGILYNSLSLKLHNLKFTLTLILTTTLIIGSYFLILSRSWAGGRLAEITTSNSGVVKKEVNEQRRISLEIPYFRDIVINKYAVEANSRISSYLGFFSPTFLFLKSQGNTDIYYDSNHGYFYLLDIPFLILGIMALSANFTRGVFVLSLILLAVFPAAVKTTGDTIYALRAALAYPLISGVIAWGIYYLSNIFLGTKNTAKKNISKLFIILIIICFSFSLGYFLIMYWYRTPFDKAMGWYHHKRVLTSYITRLNPKIDKKIIVVTSQPSDTFNTYIFFSNLYNTRDNIIEINKVYKSLDYQYKGIRFINNCKEISENDLRKSVVFIEQTVGCLLDQSNTKKIANPRDGGGVYNIVNETLCDYPTNKYPYPRSLKDFNVETLSDKDFCDAWITNPDQPV